jgi:histidinol-phosphate aminotransferase
MTDHGGPDALGLPRWDFSTNANACGPAPIALQAVCNADATRYPDPRHAALREALGALHGVPAARIVPAASASEFIVRATCAVALRRPGATVHSPRPGYGDHAAAASAAGLRGAAASVADLVWHTDPGSPFGRSQAAPEVGIGALCVIDCAYEPLRLEGSALERPARAWQLWSPNKALGLTGVRGAYAVAPADAEAWQTSIENLAPSWPWGAHAVAMLQAWALPDAQSWLRESLETLREWKREQLAHCTELGWICEPSDMPFFVARWPSAFTNRRTRVLAGLRECGVKLRDAEPLGVPGAVRLSVQPPAAQRALVQHWREVTSR